jgi:hypothetical protein
LASVEPEPNQALPFGIGNREYGLDLSQRERAFIVAGPLPDGVNEFGRVLGQQLVALGSLEQHSDDFQIVICALGRERLGQRVAIGDDIGLGEFAQRSVGAIAQEGDKLRD